jgi:hypothetical protein
VVRINFFIFERQSPAKAGLSLLKKYDCVLKEIHNFIDINY